MEDYTVDCILENTVNRVLESYRAILSELDNEVGTDLDEDLDEEDLAEGEEEIDLIQETAILSAICEHGLQQPSESSDEGEENTASIDFPVGDSVVDPLDTGTGPSALPELQYESGLISDIAISNAIHSKGLKGLYPGQNLKN